MLLLIIEALYFFLPAYIANMAPVFAAKLVPTWNKPMDFGILWRNKPLFGSHKTWRGLTAGIIAAIGVVWVQLVLEQYPLFASISIIDYEQQSIAALGALFGAGALLGDALKSFIKRRVGKESGARWMPYDQIDFVVGGLLAVSLVFQPSWQHIVVLLVISPILHIVVNYVGYLLKLKKVPW